MYDYHRLLYFLSSKTTKSQYHFLNIPFKGLGRDNRVNVYLENERRDYAHHNQYRETYYHSPTNSRTSQNRGINHFYQVIACRGYDGSIHDGSHLQGPSHMLEQI